MQNAKKRHFILAAEVCREASRIVKNCEEKKTPLCEHSGIASLRSWSITAVVATWEWLSAVPCGVQRKARSAYA
jgi:hypothetical protein